MKHGSLLLGMILLAFLVATPTLAIGKSDLISFYQGQSSSGTQRAVSPLTPVPTPTSPLPPLTPAQAIPGSPGDGIDICLLVPVRCHGLPRWYPARLNTDDPDGDTAWKPSDHDEETGAA
jgi:hypothetical protein